MKASLTITFAALVALVAGTPRAEANPLPTVDRWVLDNGLQVAHVHAPDRPVVSVQVWYRVGSKNDPEGRRGLARLFQYLLFEGSTHVRPGAHRDLVARVGGSASGQVLEDATTLSNRAPSQYVELLMRLEADRMRGLEWRENAVERARDRALADYERAMGDPLKRAIQPFLELAFPSHPYAWEAIGDAEEIRKVTMEELKSFYDTFFVPNNALLVVVGDVDRAAVEAAAKKHFESIPKADPPPRVSARSDTPTKPKRREIGAGRVGVVMRGFPIPEAKHDDIYALQVLSLLLGAGPGGPLHVEMTDKRKLALQAGATAIVREHPGLFLMFAAYRDPAQSAKLEKALFEVLSQIATKPPGAEELGRARNAILTDFVFRIEQSEGLANQVGMSWVLTGDPGQFVSDVAELEAVSGADIKRVIETYLTEKRSITVVMPPRSR